MKSKREGYITFMDYFATGEGRTVEINFCYADSEKEAIEKHLDRFDVKDKAARDYFRLDIVAHKSNSKKAEKMMEMFIASHKWILKCLNEAGLEFYFKLYFNYS